MNITDTGATQVWAVSFFFLNLVLAITIAIISMSNTGPGMIKTNNKPAQLMGYSIIGYNL